MHERCGYLQTSAGSDDRKYNKQEFAEFLFLVQDTRVNKPRTDVGNIYTPVEYYFSKLFFAILKA